MNAKKWIRELLITVFGILIVMSLVIYWYDPFCFYRIPEDRIIIDNSRFINPGIIQNSDYDAAIIGSSMTQNFDVTLFQTELSQNPVKLTAGGMSVQALDLTMQKTSQSGKVKNYLVDINIPALNKEEDALESYATYLYDENPFNDFQYWIGYEAWMRFLPLNVGLDVLDQLGYPATSLYGTKSVDEMGEWYQSAQFGAEILKNDYIHQKNQVSEQNTDGMYNRMKRSADEFIATLKAHQKDAHISVFFPPYSVLYWYDTQQKEIMQTFFDIKEYIVSQISQQENMTVFDFQTIPEIQDLDNYKDVSHYGKEVSDRLVELMAEGKYMVDPSAVKQSNEKLLEQVRVFQKENADWLPK